MDIDAILKENQELKALVSELQEKLKRYTNPPAHQAFYEKNKEKIIKESAERLKKLNQTNPDKLKEYRRNAYLKRKENGTVNLYLKLCESCKTVSASKKYDNHCLRCFIYLFPDKQVIRNYKTKETATANFVTEKFPNFTWNIDKKVEDGCSKRRPDLMCDLGYQVLIVEVDENQHDTYDCSCENKRIMQISQDIGHRPLIFIRFNPDDYLDCSGNNISSCWTTTAKTGIIKIKNNKTDEWSKRLAALQSQIEYWSNEENKTEKTIEIVQLFYDGFQ
jgi:hypothetical protein